MEFEREVYNSGKVEVKKEIIETSFSMLNLIGLTDRKVFKREENKLTLNLTKLDFDCPFCGILNTANLMGLVVGLKEMFNVDEIVFSLPKRRYRIVQIAKKEVSTDRYQFERISGNNDSCTALPTIEGVGPTWILTEGE